MGDLCWSPKEVMVCCGGWTSSTIWHSHLRRCHASETCRLRRKSCRVEAYFNTSPLLKQRTINNTCNRSQAGNESLHTSILAQKQLNPGRSQHQLHNIMPLIFCCRTPNQIQNETLYKGHTKLGVCWSVAMKGTHQQDVFHCKSVPNSITLHHQSNNRFNASTINWSCICSR